MRAPPLLAAIAALPLATLLVVSAATAPPAHAAPASARAAAAIQRDWKRARARFADGDFAAARKLLLRLKERVAEAKLLARVHLYLGLVAAVQLDKAATRTAFVRALMLDPRIEVDPKRFKPELVARFRRVRATVRGRLEVTVSGGKGTSVWIDDKRAGAPPYRASLPVGSHTVELRAGVQVLKRQRVVLSVAAPVQLAWDAARLGTRVLRPPGGWAGTASAAAGASGGSPKRDGRTGRLWTWVALGSTIAAAAAAVGLGIAAVNDHAAACDIVDPDDTRDCTPAGTLSDDDARRYNDLRSSLSTKRTATNVMIAVSATLAAGTVLLYVFEGRGARQARASRARERGQAWRWRLTPASLSLSF